MMLLNVLQILLIIFLMISFMAAKTTSQQITLGVLFLAFLIIVLTPREHDITVRIEQGDNKIEVPDADQRRTT